MQHGRPAPLSTDLPDVMDERAFWAEARRWMKLQNQANTVMIAAIERRFGPFGEQRRQERHGLQPVGRTE
jgi:hypothetical protein